MKRWMMIVALASASPAVARDLVVPASKGWQHAATGMILMPQLAGLSRTALTDSTADEHDVWARYGGPDEAIEATVFLFHPAIPDVGLWFDRSRVALEQRDIFRSAAPATADPIAVTPPGATVASALRQTYAVPGGRYRSTALMMVPMGEWMVGIRMSAKALTADQLDARLQQFVAAIRWPAASGIAVPAAVMKDCATPLTFTKAKPVQANATGLLASLIMSTAVAANKSTPTASGQSVDWCRDGEGQVDYGVYRAGGDSKAYALALYDAGRVVHVAPSILGQIDKTSAYAVALTDVDGAVSQFPEFSAMPSPKQVWAVVRSGQRSGITKGNTISIDAKALK